MNEISAHRRVRRDFLFSALPLRLQEEAGHLQPGRELILELDHGGTLILNFQPPEFLFMSHSIYGSLLEQLKLTKTYSVVPILYAKRITEDRDDYRVCSLRKT